MFTEVLLLFCTLLLVVYIFNWMWSSRDLPPGPPPLPIIGSVLSLKGSSFIHVTLTKMAKKYGDVFTVYFPTGLRGCKPTIVINSIATAREALITQKDAFSGRPYLFTFDLVLQGGEGLGLTDFTMKTIMVRKVVHSAIRLYQPQLEVTILQEAEDLVARFGDYKNQAFNPRKDISLAINNVISSIIYGQRYHQNDEEFLKEDAANEKIVKLLNPTHILNFFPWLLKLPISSYKRAAIALYDRISSREHRFQEAKRTFRENEIRHLVDALLQAKLDEERDPSCSVNLRDVDLTATINTLFGAGSETAATTLRWLLAYLMNYPDIQEKLHAEMTNVFGEEKITLQKRKSCHYLEATLSEVLRHSSVAPVFAHKTTCDTTLSGSHIPKDTSVLLNYYAINNDERQWDNPRQFNPNRFIDAEGKFTGMMKISHMPFGAGRRSCIGESLAKTELFLFSATLIKNFKFETPPSSAPPDIIDGRLGITFAPKAYKVVAKKR